MEQQGLSRQVIGAGIEVHRTLGAGFLESVYLACLELELELNLVGIPSRRQVALPVRYKGLIVPLGFRADMVVAGTIIVEVKAAQIKANTTHGLYGDAGRRLASLTRMLRLAARLANNGIHPTPRDKTFGAWITAQMTADPNRTEKQPIPPRRPILVSVTPSRATWRANPRRRWTEAHCLRHRWSRVGPLPLAADAPQSDDPSHAWPHGWPSPRPPPRLPPRA